jgi:hypothetical protein
MRDLLLILLIWLLGLLLHAKIRPRIPTPRRPNPPHKSRHSKPHRPPKDRPHPDRPPTHPQSPKARQLPHLIHGVQEVVSSNLAGPTNTQRQSPPPQTPPSPV